MANHLINDRGQSVLAIGAPGSQARVRIQYPKLIESINSYYWASNCKHTRGEALDDLAIQNKITSKIERESIIDCTDIN